MMTVAVLAVVTALAACKPEAAGSTVDGADLYSKMCVTCHGSTGQPSPTMVARLGVRDLTAAELRDRITPVLVEQQVRKGSVNKLMPAFEGALTDAQIKAIAAYVSSPQFLAPR
ncbi:MAG: cytochrome c [Deltaproteobacteria bacterium]|nr:cytochrome c [Deltaproteobacteria bacterium]